MERKGTKAIFVRLQMIIKEEGRRKRREKLDLRAAQWLEEDFTQRDRRCPGCPGRLYIYNHWCQCPAGAVCLLVGVMAPVNLLCRTFTLRRLHVSPRDWIDTVCGGELSAATSSFNLPHRPFTASSPRRFHFSGFAFDLLSFEEGKGKKEND